MHWDRVELVGCPRESKYSSTDFSVTPWSSSRDRSSSFSRATFLPAFWTSCVAATPSLSKDHNRCSRRWTYSLRRVRERRCFFANSSCCCHTIILQISGAIDLHSRAMEWYNTPLRGCGKVWLDSWFFCNGILHFPAPIGLSRHVTASFSVNRIRWLGMWNFTTWTLSAPSGSGTAKEVSGQYLMVWRSPRTMA